MALVAGSLFSGFLLSPILVLSRHIAQRPVRRLRKPKDKLRQRRLLALGFYAGLFLIVVGLIGLWTRWCLGNRDPWLWVIFWLLEGRNKWSRPGLLVYWALLGSLSVAGWTRQLARSKKFRVWNTNGGELDRSRRRSDHLAACNRAGIYKFKWKLTSFSSDTGIWRVFRSALRFAALSQY